MKNKTLFDHINNITNNQSPDYFDKLNETEKRQWSNYMIHRFLSMKMDWIEIVNEIQRYNLSPSDVYKLYTNILPKKKQWLKYIKSKKDKTQYPKWLIETICKYYDISTKEAVDYIKIFYLTDEGKSDLKMILEKYGIEPKLIKKEARL